MTTRHPILREDIDFTQLRVELSARLGRRVEVVAREAEGDQPGELMLEEADGTVIDLDSTLVAEVVTAHQRPLSSDEQAIAEFDAATTVLERLQVWRRWLGRRVATERRRRELIRDIRERRSNSAR